MNGIDPLLTTFVSYCVGAGGGRSGGGQTCESGCLILFFIPMTSAFVSRHPGNVTPHYSTLRCFRKCPLFSLLVFFFFLKAHTKLFLVFHPPSPAIKDTSGRGTVHKCNAIWLIPTFVRVFLQMTKHSADLIYCCLNSGSLGAAKNPIQIQSHGGIFSVCIRQGQKAYQYPITLELKKPHRSVCERRR